MNDKITVCLGKGGQREMAESFARKNNVPIMDKPGEHLTVMFDSRGVSLTGYGLIYQGDFEGMLQTEDFPMKCWYVRPKLRARI
jgi:16S rRNA (guanine1516-N2)-methyltransferase